MGESFLVKRGGGSNIKSIQQGVVSQSFKSITIPISPINKEKSLVEVSVESFSRYGYHCLVMCSLVSNNAIKLQRGNDNVTYASNVIYRVIEFNNVKSRQEGTFTLSGNNIPFNEIVTINTINPFKSILYATMMQTDWRDFWVDLAIQTEIVDSTHIRFFNSRKVIYEDSGLITVHWQLIEFK